jgi:F1F0 ATPase subunit 2
VRVYALDLTISWAVGLGLGWLFFAGLWWTVRRLPKSRHPVLLSVGSLVVRTAGVVAGLICISSKHWSCLVAALVGILLMRAITVRCWGPRKTETALE